MALHINSEKITDEISQTLSSQRNNAENYQSSVSHYKLVFFFK